MHYPLLAAYIAPFKGMPLPIIIVIRDEVMFVVGIFFIFLFIFLASE